MLMSSFDSSYLSLLCLHNKDCGCEEQLLLVIIVLFFFLEQACSGQSRVHVITDQLSQREGIDKEIV
jgi:hypothetical protein